MPTGTTHDLSGGLGGPCRLARLVRSRGPLPPVPSAVPALLPVDDLPDPQRRYAKLLTAAAMRDVDAESVPVAAALARHVGGELPESVDLPGLADAADGFGHKRPHYAGLFAYAAVRAGLDASSLLDELDARSGSATWPADGMPAAEDGRALATSFDLLALAAAGRRVEEARAVFTRLAGQRAMLIEDGANPEPRWYAELVLLHALASFAALDGDAGLRDAAAGIAAYHQAETQPDHATGQPWAVHAALLSADTFPLADLLLLPASLPGGGEGIGRILLADAALALRTTGFVG